MLRMSRHDTLRKDTVTYYSELKGDSTMAQYVLEILAPAFIEGTAAEFRSDEPFGAISIGDLLDPREWPNPGEWGRANHLLLVKAITHHIRKNYDDVLEHRIVVHTHSMPEENIFDLIDSRT